MRAWERSAHEPRGAPMSERGIGENASRALALAERLLRFSSTDALLAFDAELRCTYVSDALEHLFGLPRSACLGRRLGEVFPSLARADEEDHLRAALAGRAEVSRACAFERPDGAPGWFEAYYSPLEPEPGRIEGAVALVRDVTERELAEQRLGESERRFQIMADSAPVLLWMARDDSLCTFFNQTWLRFTGRTAAQEWGVGWAEGVHFEDLQACLDAYLAAFGERRAFEMEYRLRRADGEYRWILDRGVPRYMPDGTFAGYIGSCVDITEHRQLEAELRTSLRGKDDFLAMVSHELRTPIAALSLQLDLLHREPLQDHPRALGLAGRMRGSVDRITTLIDSTLQLARIKGGHLVVESQRFDLVAVTEGALSDLRPQAERKGLTLTLSVGPALAPLESDQALVRLILANLVGNAVKFTEAGAVEVTLSAAQGVHRIEVADTGPGISMDDRERIFRPFEQVASRRQKHKPGVGLGLSLVRSLTAALRGEVDLETELGRGSRFTVALPSGALTGLR